MQYEQLDLRPIEALGDIAFSSDISFDPDEISLRGVYADQLSAYRAKKIWVETLESCFLLAHGQDFTVGVRSSLEKSEFNLTCQFDSACARYAFWRLTNHQAPEAQYLIETAHIPASNSRHEDFLFAPDMRSAIEQSLDPAREKTGPNIQKKSVLTRLNQTLSRLLKRL